MGGATDRARPGLADGSADQEPRRIRLRSAADSVDGGPRREPVRGREADRVRDRAPRRGRGAARAPEDVDARGDRGRAGRGAGRSRTCRRAGSVNAGTPAPAVETPAPPTEVPIPPPPTNPAGPDQQSAAALAALARRRQGSADAGGRHRGARRRCAAAGSRGTGHVRDVGDRHRQVAGWHLQRTARAGRRDRREDGGTAHGTCRRHDHRGGREELADDRSAGEHRARAPRGR